RCGNSDTAPLTNCEGLLGPRELFKRLSCFHVIVPVPLGDAGIGVMTEIQAGREIVSGPVTAVEAPRVWPKGSPKSW
ncbi:hypothetical protein U0070_011477, partial [Myodes glareolus]